MSDEFPSALRSALVGLIAWLDSAGIPAMIIGGVAASILGRPRFTRDVDALAILQQSEWQRAIDVAASFGILPRIDDALDFARRSRVLLMRHDESGVDLDVAFGGLPFEESAVKSSQLHDIGGIKVRLPRIEDLLVMKAIARRPKDLEDIRALLDAHPEADIVGARRWIREFAIAAAAPDILTEFDRLIAQHRNER